MSLKLDPLKDAVCEWIDQSQKRFYDLAQTIYDNPELGFVEKKASHWLSEQLAQSGYIIEKKLAGLNTAFRGIYPGKKSRPAIALLCEYDALPEMGHGCGHNLIGTASTWAGVALSRLDTKLPGTVVVMGTPGEETDGGKVILVNNHCFDEIDAVLMFHPSSENRVISTSLAIDALEVTYHGKTAHAAGAPHQGINALDAVIMVFNGINALREHLKDDVRIHGIITEGGKAPNVVPGKAQARFYLRARDRSYLNEIVEKFKQICQGASLMTGASYEIRNFENSNDNLISNHTLGSIFEENLHKLGVKEILPPQKGSGSTDMGNVSQVVPAIHPYLAIGNNLRGHSTEFADATVSKEGLATLKTAAKALAMTTLDLMFEPNLLKQVKTEFKNH